MFRDVMLADRVTQLPSDPITEIFSQIPAIDAERKKNGLEPIIRLNVGEPHLPIAPLVPTALSEYLAKPEALASFAYPPIGGTPKTLQAIAKLYENYYHIPISEKNVMICHGATQGLWNAFNILLNPGDEVGVFEPFYGPYNTQASVLGATTVKIPTLENNFRPSAAALDKFLSEHPRVKAVIFNYPNNPSGIDLTEEEAKEMAVVLLKHKKAILIDDVYRELNDKKHVTVVDVCPELLPLVIIINSGSKGLVGGPALRIGTVWANREWIEAMTKMQGLHTSGISNLIQLSAQSAIEARLEGEPSYGEWLIKSCAEYEKNIHYVNDQVSAMGFKSTYGGSGLFLLTSAKCLMNRRVPDTIEFVTATGEHHFIEHLQAKVGAKKFKNDKQIATYLMHAAGVALVPGCAFGIDEKEGYLRFSCAKELPTLEKAVSYLKQAVDNIPELELAKVSEGGLFAKSIAVESRSPTMATREILQPGCRQFSN